MKVFLLGATGGTGRAVLAHLLAGGHQVAALVRNPAAISIRSPNLQIISGNIHHPEGYQHALDGCEVVISAIGAGTSRKPTDVYSEGGRQLLTAMQQSGARRIISLTAAFDPTAPQFNSFPLKYIVRPLFRNVYADMEKWEQLLQRHPEIDWTIVRPSRLTNGPQRSQYRIAENHVPEKGSTISRKDLAHFLVQQLTSPGPVHQKLAIAY